jgi:hypothetical protein
MSHPGEPLIVSERWRGDHLWRREGEALNRQVRQEMPQDAKPDFAQRFFVESRAASRVQEFRFLESEIVFS